MHYSILLYEFALQHLVIFFFIQSMACCMWYNLRLTLPIVNEVFLQVVEGIKTSITLFSLLQVMMKAIQLHPAVPGLWIYAAVWEAEHNSNVTAARSLMQQGIRSCPKSEILWHEYFRMELIFAEKVKARRLVLGLASQEKPAIIEAGEVHENGVSNSETDVAATEEKPRVSHHTASCKIAQVIYRNAIAEIPDNLQFRQRFLEILETIDVEKLEALEGEIYAGMRKDFVTDENSWAWLARRQYVKAESKGMDILECRKEATNVWHVLSYLSLIDLSHASLSRSTL